MTLEHENFKKAVAESAAEFGALSRQGRVRIISHLDADGISACSIIIRALNRRSMKYAVSIVHQVDEWLVSQLAKENNDVIIFTDIGAGQLMLISKYLSKKKVFVL